MRFMFGTAARVAPPGYRELELAAIFELSLFESIFYMQCIDNEGVRPLRFAFFFCCAANILDSLDLVDSDRGDAA